MRIRTVAFLAAAFVLAITGAVGATVWLLRDDSQPAAATSTAAQTLTVSGEFVLTSGQFVWEAEPRFCVGKFGYEDIAMGATVTVTDPAGKVVALGKLTNPVPQMDPADPSRAVSCTLDIEVTGVPAGLGIYGIEVSHRGVIRKQESELANVELGF